MYTKILNRKQNFPMFGLGGAGNKNIPENILKQYL